MSYSELPDTRISGSGKVTLPGYGELKISGSGKVSSGEVSSSGSSVIPGGLKLRSVKTSGSTKIRGDIHADTAKFSGSAMIEGTLECEELEKSGSLKIGAVLRADYASLSGSTDVSNEGFIRREIESSGSLRLGGNLVSDDRIMYSGVLWVEGTVQAVSFEARLSRDESFIRDGLNADYINIQRSHEDWRNHGSLRTRDITGDDIILENVECNDIRGKNITVKRGCHIMGTIYYSENITVSPDARLENEPEKTG